MSDAQSTTGSSARSETDVPELIGKIVTKFQQIQARFTEIEKQQRWDLTAIKDKANIDLLRLQDLQACILKHDGQWKSAIAGTLTMLEDKVDSGKNIPSPNR